MAGRKPLPSNLKVLKGTARKGRENPDEPKPNPGIPQPPAHLGRYALMEWGRIVPELQLMGLITNVDMAALAAYCQCFDRWVRAESDIDKNGMMVETTNGNIIQSPSVGIANTALTLMHRYLTEFGMTPSSRSRISAPKKDEKDNPWSGFEGAKSTKKQA